jgi:hypothetical protein
LQTMTNMVMKVEALMMSTHNKIVIATIQVK